MTTTSNLGITLIEQSQAQKEVTANEALVTLDALLNVGALDKDLATPPVSPAEGDLYIVAASATDDWATHEDDIAYYNNGAWKFITPQEGLLIWVSDEDVVYRFDGTGWGEYLQNLPFLGINTTADTTNRLAVRSGNVLFSSETDDVQIKVSKDAVGDTASYLFQTNFSGRAEFGLIGDDDFQLKVSANGSSFTQSFVVDKDTGDVDFKEGVTFSGTVSGLQTTDSLPGFIENPADKDYTLALDIPYGATITETVTKSLSGTCTATFKINGTALGGTANSVSSTEDAQTHSSSNVVAAGDDIIMTISSNSSCVDMAFTVKYTRDV